MTNSLLTIIGMAATVILAAEKIPRAMAALVRACIPLAHAVRDLCQAIRGDKVGRGMLPTTTPDGSTYTSPGSDGEEHPSETRRRMKVRDREPRLSAAPLGTRHHQRAVRTRRRHY